MEVDYTTNATGHICVSNDIETALIRLTVRGIKGGHWELSDSEMRNSELIQFYLKD